MEKIMIKLDNRIRIRKESLSFDMITFLEKRLIFKNPLYYTNERYGRPNYGIEPILRCIWEDKDNGDLVITKGFLAELIRVFHKARIKFELKDFTQSLQEVDFNFHGAYYGYQYEAWYEVPKHRFGILVGPLGCGKKIIALSLIARRRIPALVIVATKRQMYIWKEIAIRFLDLKDEDIGLVGDRYREFGKKFTVAITLTLYKVLDQLKHQIGFLIIDQCDKASIKVFFKASMINCPYVLGLANASKRSDRLTRLMYSYLGPRICEIWPEDGWMSFQGLGKTRPVLKIKSTSFTYNYRGDWHEMITALCQDEERNRLITADILEETADPSTKALVISERINHLEMLLQQIKRGYSDGAIITGYTREKEREYITARFDRGKLQIILITFKTISTIKIKKIDRLFIASPVKYDDHIVQIIGKMLGAGQGDPQSIIYDYRDKPELLDKSLNQRLKIYRAMGAII
jgi:superfamily II DNA or RNA helicase